MIPEGRLQSVVEQTLDTGALLGSQCAEAQGVFAVRLPV